MIDALRPSPAPVSGAAAPSRRFEVPFVSRYIVRKITVPYIAISVLLALALSYAVVNLVSTNLEARFTEELADAGRSANEAMVKVEDRQLTVLRNLAFTMGVDEALAERNVDRLQELLAPVTASARVPYVDVLTPDGTPLLALRSPDLGPDAASRVDPQIRQWSPVRRVLNGDRDQYGDKFDGVILTPWGRLLVVAAPVRLNDALVGVIVVGQPLESLAETLSSEAGSKAITLYTLEGEVLVSTVRVTGSQLGEVLRLSPEALQAFRSGERIVMRKSDIDGRPYVESISFLVIRREPALLMGVGDLVAIVNNAGASALWTMFVIFAVAILFVFCAGWLIARWIVGPVFTLVSAARRIRADDLDNLEIPIRTHDEIGVLSETMNEAIGGLRERRRAQNAIERYISPLVYRKIQEQELTLGGVEHEITVFKTDIRDFTPLSETMEPDGLVNFLNLYFEYLVRPVHAHGGEVDKYMGDSILAKFGATEPQPDHARQAVWCMIEMMEACEQFNEEAQRRGWPAVRMGIGANTGPAVVGNIGAHDRMEYTIISDAVNTSQRIEELCKELGWDLLISESTYLQCRDAVEVGEPWEMELRGKTRATLVYPVLGRIGQVAPERRRAYYRLLVNQEQGLHAASGY
jgi:class 3 adenylate cyclase